MFCLSLLIWIAAGFGDPAAPVNAWVNRYGALILLTETALVVVVSVLAMVFDRRATLALKQQQEATRASTANSASDIG
jgi:hypothetical protein